MSEHLWCCVGLITMGSRDRPGVTQRVPGDLVSQISVTVGI